MSLHIDIRKIKHKILSFLLITTLLAGLVSTNVSAGNTSTYNISADHNNLYFNYGDEHAQSSYRTYRTLGYTITVSTIDMSMLYRFLKQTGKWDASQAQKLLDDNPITNHSMSNGTASPNFGYWFIPRDTITGSFDTNFDQGTIDSATKTFSWTKVVDIMNHTPAAEMFPFLAEDEAFMSVKGNYKYGGQYNNTCGMGDMLAAGILGVYFDGVMTYALSGVQKGYCSAKEDGTAKLSGEVFGASYLTSYSNKSYGKPMKDIDSMINMGWGNNTVTAIRSRYGKYFCLKISSGDIVDHNKRPTPEPDPDLGDDEPEYDKEYQSGRLTPYAYTYHYSNTYDVGEAIPSGETITNGYEADRLS